MALYVHESGTAGAESIVFLHGVGASGWMWEKQLAALTDFHCLNVDLPGHGKSLAVDWVSLADTADQIAGVIQAQATKGRAHLVGLSLGGYIALVLLERHPNLADRIVISGVTAQPWPNRALLNPQLRLTTSLLNKPWYVKMQAKALPLSPTMQAAFIENLLAMSMDTYRLIAEQAADFHAPTALNGLNNPTLVVAGGKESKIIRGAVRDIAAMMPNAQGRIAPSVGHGWNVEAPDLFNAMLRAWFTDKPLPARLQTV